MPIIKATDDSLEKGPVTALVHDKVLTRSGPNPPNESVQSVGERIADPNFVCMIDDEHDTVAGFHVQPVAQEVLVIWWLPRASWAENNMPLLVPVFGAACEEVMKLWPGSGPWKIYGWYPGVGENYAERAASSLNMVTAWIDYFGSSPTGAIASQVSYPPPATRQMLDDRGKKYQVTYGPLSRVDDMAAFAAWVAAQ